MELEYQRFTGVLNISFELIVLALIIIVGITLLIINFHIFLKKDMNYTKGVLYMLKSRKKLLLFISICFICIVLISLIFIKSNIANCNKSPSATPVNDYEMQDNNNELDNILAQAPWSLTFYSPNDFSQLRELLDGEDEPLLDFLRKLCDYGESSLNRFRTREDIEKLYELLDSSFLPIDHSWEDVFFFSSNNEISFTYFGEDDFFYNISILLDENSFHDFMAETVNYRELIVTDITYNLPNLMSQNISAYLIEEERHQFFGIFKLFNLNVHGFHVSVQFSDFPNEEIVWDIMNSLEFARGVL